MTDRIVLGTAGLGMPYGISNKTGKPDLNSACDIVKTAFDQGITRFDTAQAYGDSEEVLGSVFDKLKIGSDSKVYSKLHPQLDCCDPEAVQRSVESSLRKLGLKQLEGLLLHHEDQLSFWDKGLGDALKGLVTQGKIKSIGVSFYTPQKALAALDIEAIDMVQVPANILDRRFEDAGVFKKAQERNKKIFVRSIFLQGLLLMPLDQLPASMKYAQPFLRQIEEMASAMNLTRQELVLGYAARQWPGSFVLFGAENSRQVLDNVKGFSSKTVFKFDDNIFKSVPENILNPMLWPKSGD